MKIMSGVDALDHYLDLLSATALRFVEDDRSAMDIMQRSMKRTAVPELVGLRVQFLTQQDHERSGGLMASDCFSDMEGDERLAAFVVCHELDDEISRLDVTRRFRRYQPTQPLFQCCPALWDEVRDTELVATTKARHLRRSGLVEVPGGWGRVDAYLPPELLRWAEDSFPELPIFLRLDPWFGTKSRPEEPLRKAGVRPARPGWWRTLALRNREGDGGHYVLQAPGDASAENVDEFWEYHLRGVRSLEVHAQRDNAGNLSMMIEELVEARRPDGRIVGRCIHLDTDAAAGTDARSATMNHLDLAINVYFGDAARRRRAMRLCNGMVEDASVRTHLLRVEGAPFSSSVEFARQFFESTVLLAEWMRDQFGGGESPFEDT